MSTTDPPPPAPAPRDHEAFMELVQPHLADLSRYLASRVRPRDVAADLVQVTLMAAWAQFGTFRNANVRGWLFTIAKRRLIDHVRQPANRQPGGDDGLAAVPAPAAPEPDAGHEALAWCLNHALDDDDRYLIVEACYNGRTAADLAAELGLKAGAVQSRIHRARLRLGECVIERSRP